MAWGLLTAASVAFEGLPTCEPVPLAPLHSEARWVTFSLLRGGSHREAYTSFVNSRECLHQVIPASLTHDDVAFHDGNVPIAIQRDLQAEWCVYQPDCSTTLSLG
jgi:hypothetical protein